MLHIRLKGDSRYTPFQFSNNRLYAITSRCTIQQQPFRSYLQYKKHHDNSAETKIGVCQDSCRKNHAAYVTFSRVCLSGLRATGPTGFQFNGRQETGPGIVRHDQSCQRSAEVERYVMCADIYGASPHTGRGGWTWYTGAASWIPWKHSWGCDWKGITCSLHPVSRTTGSRTKSTTVIVKPCITSQSGAWMKSRRSR